MTRKRATYRDGLPAGNTLRRPICCSALIAVLVTLISAPVVFAQSTGKLTGFVADAQTDDALIGANVVLSGTLLGAATDQDGQFTLLGVPVGEYTVVISYVGYQDVSIEGVEINGGYTRALGRIALSPGLFMEVVVVQYERPLIQRDAIGVPMIVTDKEIVNLPVRGVVQVASIQPGVGSVEGRDELNVRGGRSSEVAYYIDGVKIISDYIDGIGAIGIPQAAIREQEMLIGSISARYGDVMSGIVNVTTKSGASAFFGSLEALTSSGLDPYGTSIFSGSVGGPISGKKLNFFLAGEYATADDGAPRAATQLRLDSAELERLENSPQALSALLEDGTRVWVEFPGDMEIGASLPVDSNGDLIVNEDGSIEASDGSVIQLPANASLTSNFPTPVYAWEVVDPSLFSWEKARQSAGLTRYSGTANVTFRPSEKYQIRVGGRTAFSGAENISQSRVLFAPGAYTQTDNRQWQGFASWSHYLSASAFYQLQVDFSERKGWSYDPRFSQNVEDLLFYGDLDHPAFEVMSRFKKNVLTDGVATYENLFQDGAMIIGSSIAHRPGGFNTPYSESDVEQWRFSGSATAQVGIHQLEFGGEFEQQSRRRWTISADEAHRLAGWYDDSESCSIGVCGAELAQDVDGDGERDAATSYATLPDQLFGDNYYGYDVRGLDKVDSQDILGYLDGTNKNVAPWQPIYYGGYVQDKIEYRDLVLNLGLRVDVFDNNALVFSDPYALVPIVRAGTVTSKPSGIHDDFAAYFDGDQVVGYRNRDGEFFDENGEKTRAADILLHGTPKLVNFAGDDVLRKKEWEAVFDDYAPQVSLMPRVGVSFPVTDQSLFFGSYGIVSQRPSLNNFASLGRMLNRLAFEYPNPDLKPEQTVQYEIGFRQRLTDRSSFTISGFFRQVKNIETRRLVENAFPEPYATFQNIDFGTVKGIELNFDLRRIKNISLNANYTLSIAEGTEFELPAVSYVALMFDDPVRTITPLHFDQRHRINLSMDLRFGNDEGPLVSGMHPFEHVGVNVLVQAASGFPYTGLALENQSDIAGSVLRPVGEINSFRMPSSSRIDMRIDRAIPLRSGRRLSIFMWIQNLLNTSNVFQVYNSTGLAAETGFLDSPDGVAYLDSQLRPETAEIVYANQIRNPEHFGIPRMVRIGAVLVF